MKNFNHFFYDLDVITLVISEPKCQTQADSTAINFQ